MNFSYLNRTPYLHNFIQFRYVTYSEYKSRKHVNNIFRKITAFQKFIECVHLKIIYILNTK